MIVQSKKYRNQMSINPHKNRFKSHNLIRNSISRVIVFPLIFNLKNLLILYQR